jgi:uncharacterized protein (TIGR02145 family)
MLASFVQSDAPSCSFCAGTKLKAKSGWNSCSPSGSSYTCLDTYGFAALPGGYGSSIGGSSFNGVGNVGDWWSATEDLVADDGNGGPALRWQMYYSSGGMTNNNPSKTVLQSVRCLQDSAP